MTDKELLELAAKAAGFQYNPTVKFDNKALYGCFSLDARQEEYRWSPLTNDGDALRLAVKLGFAINITPSKVYASDGRKGGATEVMDCADPYAVTRRAIVRAAAEIGKG